MEAWWTASAILGWVFASAGAAKLARLDAFVLDLRARFPWIPARVTAIGIAMTEVLCGVYLLVGDEVRGVALGALCLLAAFSVASLIQRGEACGCGGLAEVRAGRPHATANLMLAIVAAAIVLAAPVSLEWSLARPLWAYLALAILLTAHTLGSLYDVRYQRLLIDRDRYGG